MGDEVSSLEETRASVRESIILISRSVDDLRGKRTRHREKQDLLEILDLEMFTVRKSFLILIEQLL